MHNSICQKLILKKAGREKKQFDNDKNDGNISTNLDNFDQICYTQVHLKIVIGSI